MTNSVILLAAIGVVVLWFLLSGTFKLIGSFVKKIGEDTIDVLKENDEEGENKDGE